MKSMILWQNFVQLGGTALQASSAAPAMPVRRLRDQMRSNKWRSATGWTVVTGFNDTIDFNNGSNRVATIAAGTYATGTLMAAAIQSALAAAYATGSWTVTYSSFKFTITHSLTAFVLKWATGANAAKAAARDLGWTVADTGSATSQTSPAAVYQSRHYVLVDFGVAMDVQVGVALDSNASAAGSYNLQGADTSAFALTSPATSVLPLTVSDDGTMRAATFGSVQTRRYWAVIIDDVANADGFVEVGVLFLGGWLQTPDLARGVDRAGKDYSSAEFADQGANWQNRKQSTSAWSFGYEVVTRAEADEIKALAAFLLTGGDFFFVEDVTDLLSTIHYVFFTELPTAKQRGADMSLWDVALKFQEALG